ncbi:MAG: hypothetical protein ACRDJK_02865 [Actinomycetota bacterium]
MIAYVIRADDRLAFKRCRRAWDFGARPRRNLEPIQPIRFFDFDRAIHDGLAVYYFPGMWEWNRDIVRPLALEAFLKSMRKDRTRYLETRGLSRGPAEEEREWESHLELGKTILASYFTWAPGVDRFMPVRVETDFEVNIPDPRRPGLDLCSSEGLPIRYQGRVEMLVVDGDDNYWIVDHRIVREGWEELDQLLLDDVGVSFCWAWELFYMGMSIAGTIYNEIRCREGSSLGEAPPAPPGLETAEAAPGGRPVPHHRRMYVQPLREPRPLSQQGNERFRRTQISRSRAEIEGLGTQMSLEALDIADPDLSIYHTPSRQNCSRCPYRTPCIAMNEGADLAPILETSYRKRPEVEIEEGRLGGVTWSMNRGAAPVRFGGRRGSPRS